MTSCRYECVVARSVDEISEHRHAWDEFSKRKLEENIFISLPWLVATLRQYGEAMRPYWIVFIYRDDGTQRDLVGLAGFSLLAPSLLMPVPVISTLVSPHGYLSHPVLDRDFADEAFRSLWAWLDEPSHPWRIVLFDQLPDRSPVWKLVRDEATRRKRRIWLKYATSRSMLRQVDSFDIYLASLGRKRRRSYTRRWRKLEADHGAQVRLHRDRVTTPDLAERFMKLEAKSWKGEEGTALASTAAGRRFFAEITDAFDEQGALFFVETVVGENPIGMTINFVQGSTLFAFKTAYDPDFRTFSPGILTEVQSIRYFLDAKELETAESGTTGDSYVDDYWNDAADIMAVYVPTARWTAGMVLSAVELATELERLLVKTWRWIRSKSRAGLRER
jgi:CelD/BcsL family acetyltransferase involved in cellulose biosynthesis